MGEADICICKECKKQIAICVRCGSNFYIEGEQYAKCLNGGNMHICFSCDMDEERMKIEEELDNYYDEM